MRLISLLGFDISHILLILSKSSIKLNKIIVLVGNIRGEIDSRVETAYMMLKQFANMVNIDVERIDIDVIDTVAAIKKITEILENNVPAILDLGGGLRLLVIETFLAYTLLTRSKSQYITVYTVLEGRNEIIEVDLNKIKKGVEQAKMLNEREKRVLEYIVKKEGAIVTPKEILDELKAIGYNISKQQLSKILSKLVRIGLIEKIDIGKYRSS